MKRSISGTLLLFLFSIVIGTKVQAASLSLLWATETSELKTPESVIYDLKRNVLYVSNINGSPMEKDGNGFITKLSTDGNLIDLKWASGDLSAPKGMAIANDHLFVTDISRVVEIDLEDGKLIKTYPVAEAVFLNDAVADNEGNVYISDMMTDSIYRIKNGMIELWLKSEKLASPNGLAIDQDKLIVGSWGVMDGEGFATTIPGHLLIVSLYTKEISDLGNANPVGNLDGVEITANGDFLVTDWMAGTLFRIDRQGHAETLANLNQGSADLEYIQEKNLLLIPMMKDHKIVAYRFAE